MTTSVQRGVRHHSDEPSRPPGHSAPINSPATPSRREIDMAIGVLIGLRQCSERQAFSEIAAAVSETGVSLGAICRGLVELASGTNASFDHSPEVLTVWRELISGRHSVRE